MRRLFFQERNLSGLASFITLSKSYINKGINRYFYSDSECACNEGVTGYAFIYSVDLLNN